MAGFLNNLFTKKTDSSDRFEKTNDNYWGQTGSNPNNSAKNFNQGFPQNSPCNQRQQNYGVNGQWYPNGYNVNQWQQIPPSYSQKSFTPCVCPKCGANLMAESGIDTFYCQYCGTKILLQNETNLKTRFGMKKLEHAEKMVDKVVGYFDRRREQKAIEEEKKRKENNRDLRIIFVISIAIMIAIFFSLNNKGKESKAQEAELQKIVEQIQTDISNGDFDAAYVKASALNYTSGYSSTVEKKWDDTRESLITIINDLRNKSEINEIASEETSSAISSTKNDVDSHDYPTPTITPFPTFTPVSTKSVISSVITSMEIDDLASHWKDSQYLYKLKSENNMGYDAAFRNRKTVGKGCEDEYLLVDFDRNVMTFLEVPILRTGKISRCNIHTTLAASGDYNKGWQARDWSSGDTEYYVWAKKGENGYVQKYNKKQEKVGRNGRYEELNYISIAISDLQECGYSYNNLAPEK